MTFTKSMQLNTIRNFAIFVLKTVTTVLTMTILGFIFSYPLNEENLNNPIYFLKLILTAQTFSTEEIVKYQKRKI